MIQRNEIRTLAICVLLCVATGSAVVWYTGSRQQKIAVVDAVKLFDGYNMKKELEEIAKHDLQAESHRLDSAANALQMIKTTSASLDEVKKLEYTYGYLKDKLTKDYEQSNHDINEQVWKRLNALMQEYGKKNGLHLIIGANGMGSVLYNDEYYDRTDEAIKYVNTKYAEGN